MITRHSLHGNFGKGHGLIFKKFNQGMSAVTSNLSQDILSYFFFAVEKKTLRAAVIK